MNIDLTQLRTAEDLAAAARVTVIADLSRIRWQQETGGLTLPDGTAVRTDRETRASITEAVNSLRAGLMAAPVSWKLASGWVDLTQANLEGIAAAVATHVAGCFAAERAVSNQLDGLASLDGFDLQAAFDAAIAGQGGG